MDAFARLHKDCGGDGCAGSCGTCGDGEQCNASGYTGWCGLSADEPGVGFAWEDAWDVVAACN